MEDAPFDLEQTDRLLSTTRAVRRRLDLTRPVPDDVLLTCIDLAEQAPTGGNQPSRRWLVVRDAEKKRRLAELYREAGGERLLGVADRLSGTGRPQERVMGSAAHLVEHFAEVPAIVIVTIYGEHDGSGRPGLFDSVLQAAWSFALALRSRGLGTAWTTILQGVPDEVAEVLAIPDGVTQVVTFPVGYTLGTDFSPAPRRPAREITFFDEWGRTRVQPSGDGAWHLADSPGLAVEVDVDAPPSAVWALVTDIETPARAGTELQSAEWVDGAGPALGSRFVGHNRLEGYGEWQTTSEIVEYEPERVFAWDVAGREGPSARWRFELAPLVGGSTRLRQAMTITPKGSGTAKAIAAEPEREDELLIWRAGLLRRNMTTTVNAIKALAEEAAGQR
jgi:nitroreductase/uncharacterized protein YndB with AHSA1/START domain